MRHNKTLIRAGLSRSAGSVWWGEAPFWPYNVNEAVDVLIPKILPGRNLRRAGVWSAAADKRTVGLRYVTISRVPTKCSCNLQTARLGASIGLTGPGDSTRPQFFAAAYRTIGSLAPNFYNQTLKLALIRLHPRPRRGSNPAR